MSKQATPEEHEAALARRAAFRELCKQVASMDETQRGAFVARVGIITCEGRSLSVHNQVLIAMQRPDASVVGGFFQWIKAGRSVRKGEHGCMIWVPTARRGTTTAEQGTSSTDSSDSSDSTDRPGFIMGTVFDITQTEVKA